MRGDRGGRGGSFRCLAAFSRALGSPLVMRGGVALQLLLVVVMLRLLGGLLVMMPRRVTLLEVVVVHLLGGAPGVVSGGGFLLQLVMVGLLGCLTRPVMGRVLLLLMMVMALGGGAMILVMIVVRLVVAGRAACGRGQWKQQLKGNHRDERLPEMGFKVHRRRRVSVHVMEVSILPMVPGRNLIGDGGFSKGSFL